LRKCFGADYPADVLIGSREGRILANKHDRLSPYGLLQYSTRSALRDWIEQPVHQECIERLGEYGVLKLTGKGRRMLKGHGPPLLLEAAKKKSAAKSFAAKDSRESVDRELFEELRELRRELARERGVPAYIIFGDITLRDMARKSTSVPDDLLRVSGIGMKKLEQYGEGILEITRKHAAGR
jgi:ATP-dependent DNA helicase RecQ